MPEAEVCSKDLEPPERLCMFSFFLSFCVRSERKAKSVPAVREISSDRKFFYSSYL
jgi:hypothetical protein